MNDVLSCSAPAVISISSNDASYGRNSPSPDEVGPVPTDSTLDLSPSFRQTLRELRHNYLARIVRANPPSNARPGLDVQPLSERAWLEDFGQTAGANESELSLRIY